MAKTGEMLIMLIMLIFLGTLSGEGGGGRTRPLGREKRLTFPLFKAHFEQKLLETGEMLIMLIMLILVFEKSA